MIGHLNPPIRSWERRRVWIIGASSGIGAALARQLAARGAELAVSARNAEALQRLAGELAGDMAASLSASVAGQMQVLPLDITDASAVAAASQLLQGRWNGIDLVLVAAGAYQPMRATGIDLDAAKRIASVNLTGPLNVLAAVVPNLLRQRSGAIGIIGSVAGYRGLPQALAYGPTKAALINLCETLYLDLRDQGIGVHMICPGFVETPMTAVNDFKMPALISADEAARHIIRDLERGAFDIHFPKRFTRWLKLLRILPYRLYFPLVKRMTGL